MTDAFEWGISNTRLSSLCSLPPPPHQISTGPRHAPFPARVCISAIYPFRGGVLLWIKSRALPPVIPTSPLYPLTPSLVRLKRAPLSPEACTGKATCALIFCLSAVRPQTTTPGKTISQTLFLIIF